VAIYDGKVFVGVLDGRLAALDQATGKKLWSVKRLATALCYVFAGNLRVLGWVYLCAGYWNIGAAMGCRPPGPDGKTPPAFPIASSATKEPEGAENQPKATGRFLLAWDPVAQKERWRLTNVGFAGGDKLREADSGAPASRR
jgi:hypothetical protein